MDARLNEATRMEAQRRRRPPTERNALMVSASDGALPQASDAAPRDLTIQATDVSGEPAEWFDDRWWMEVVRRWGRESLSVTIDATPAALLHPVVLHQLEMLRRVAPQWRLTGRAYIVDIRNDRDVRTLARSPYHQVRFIDAPRQTHAPDEGPTLARSADELFGLIRAQQIVTGAARPVLVRVPDDRTRIGEPQTSPAVKAAAP